MRQRGSQLPLPSRVWAEPLGPGGPAEGAAALAPTSSKVAGTLAGAAGVGQASSAETGAGHGVGPGEAACCWTGLDAEAGLREGAAGLPDVLLPVRSVKC